MSTELSTTEHRAVNTVHY